MATDSAALEFSSTETRKAGFPPGGHRSHHQYARRRCSSVAEAMGAGRASLGMPMNPTTDKTYRGGNAIHLMATGLRRGYEDPRWMTYKQAADLGWQVRKGEKGTQIEFWEVKPVRDTRSEAVRSRRSVDDEPAGESTRPRFAAHPSRLHRLQRKADRRHSGIQARKSTRHSRRSRRPRRS